MLFLWVTREFCASPLNKLELEGKAFREGLVHDAVSPLCVQDPKYPAENLLSEDGVRPWLGCPKEHSRQLSVELQLERASPIGYVDVGTSLSPTPVQEPGLCPTMGSAALSPLPLSFSLLPRELRLCLSADRRRTFLMAL